MSNLDENRLFAGKSAAILGGVLLVGFAVLSTLAAVDRNARPRLEEMREPTAVADPVVPLTVPPAPDASGTPAPALVRDGIPLFIGKKEELRDSTMLKAGLDDLGKMPLYRHDDGPRHKKKGFFIKTGTGEYLHLTPEPKRHKTTKGMGEK